MSADLVKDDEVPNADLLGMLELSIERASVEIFGAESVETAEHAADELRTLRLVTALIESRIRSGGVSACVEMVRGHVHAARRIRAIARADERGARFLASIT